LIRDLLSVNVAGKEIREKRKLLICGSCVISEHKDIFERYAEGRVPLFVCMEKEHMNMVALKVASMAARVELDEVVVLTVDGSPHCIQLHMALEEVKRIVGNLNVKHIVIENGKDIEINPKCVKIARYLTKIQKLIKQTL